jgi:hypothetical protein
MRGQVVETAARGPAGERATRESSLWTHPGLLVVCIALPVLEVALLWRFGLSSALGIAPGATAPVPFATFHDLRWLMVYHRSWASFAVEAVALLVFRSGITALLVWLAWPGGVARPSVAVLVRNATVFTVVSAVLLMPWVALLFGLAVMPVSWLFFAAVPPVLAVGLLIHHGAVRSGWQVPAARTTGWVALTIAVLTMSGAALTASPAGLRLPVAAAAGLFNAWAWCGIVNVLALRRVPRRAVPLVPIALVLLLAVVAVGAGLGFRASVAPRGTTVAPAPAAASGRPVLLVSGFGGHWDGVERRWLPGDLAERRFSYRGQGPDGRALPYSAADTQLPLPRLVDAMRAQVDTFSRSSGQRVAIVAESEGALVAKTYLAANPNAPVDELVMLSPLVQPARVFFPDGGEQGWGLASGWELRQIGDLFRDLSGADMSADMPVVRTMMDHGPAVRGLLACPLPHTRELALFPLADAVATPHPSQIGIPSEVVPAFHGGLLANDRIREAVSGYLEHGRVEPATIWPVAQEILRASAAAWQVPELPLTVNPAWSGPSGRSPSCDAMAASLRQWLK